MSQLQRYDGVEFIIFSYRQLLTAATPGMLKREMKLLSSDNGQYVKCFPRDEGIEAVFSQDQGYLLAETVWDYFEKPNNLIYCEELPSGNNAVLIVIRGGNVFLDAEVSVSNLVDELSALALGSTPYQIKLFGYLPIGDDPQSFQFLSQNIASIDWLESSAFLALTPNPDYAMSSLKQAFSDLGYTQALYRKLGIGFGVLVILSFIVWFAFLRPTPIAPVVPVVTGPPPPPPDPYLNFKQALETSAPDQILTELITTLNDAYTVPGWTPQSLAWENNTATVTLSKDGGNAGILLAWKRHQPNVKLSIDSGQAVITYPLDIPSRPVPNAIYKLPDLLANLYDELDLKFPGTTVSVGAMETEEHYRQSSITISFTAQSPDSLMVLADILKGLPVVLNTATLTVNDGLLSGQLAIQLIGA